MSSFSDSFFVLSFSDLIGFLVTIISVILIIKQLADSRLATQMEGFLTISDRFAEITQAIDFVDKLSLSKEWEDFNGEEAYQHLIENKDRKENFMQVGAFYEVVSALLHRRALDRALAANTFGHFGAIRWLTLEKAIVYQRDLFGEKALYDQWEWMANNIHSH